MTHWLLAARPKTLSLSVTPLLVGAALVHADGGVFHAIPWLAALVAALCIQIGVNLHNDAADFERGADTPDRLGPRRATAEGWLSSGQVRRGAFACFAAAFLIGFYLAWVGGWPIVLLGLASLAAAHAYSGGPWPVSHTPLGEIFVLLFFGLAAVGGTYYLLTASLTGPALIGGLVAGLPAAAVLLINNYRDRETDRRAGRRTLAILLGRSTTRRLYGLLLLVPLALCLTINPDPLWRWLPLLALPLALGLLFRLERQSIDSGLNRLLAQTAQYQLALGLLLALSLLP
ncbi:MAG: 1,4-dihydroxy-2-naphthoate polyprenyltransferase [Gammaproteobacteria bacterium]|nr:1,4-dihydroxy-2-naphthoate polyprenyltransferase [Gammaproteobacteria bacterium]MBU1654462.1 1,4-dihydroxy-2-naphthoate polyprenyltransferase [Gammaproteobacteria bacterium]MBU1962620.1 1,4-dihydroxy-2-naphthoate polyprenyltransferase [Gammaproteobacteria bacterium]